MKDQLLFGLWFFLPAGVANVTPILAAKIPVLKKISYPIDSFQKIQGIRLLGNHKTWRGLVVGVVVGTFTAVIQFFLVHQYSNFFSFVPQEYFFANAYLLGFLLSFGALFGDMIKSYFKRQSAIPEGKSWLGFDQSDYVIGGLFFSSILLIFSLQFYLILALEWIGLHIIFSYLGYLFSLKKDPI